MSTQSNSARQMLAISIKDRSGGTTLSRGHYDQRETGDTQMKRLDGRGTTCHQIALKVQHINAVCMHALYAFPDGCTHKLSDDGVNDV